MQILNKKNNTRPQIWNKYKVQIAATLFAILIWFLIVTGSTYSYKVDIPVQISSYNQDFVITNDYTKTATIQVAGQGRRLLAFLLFRDARLNLNVTWTPGDTIINVTQENIALLANAKGLTVQHLVRPNKIPITIEPIISKTIPITNSTQIKTMPGYTIVGDTLLTPSIVKVTGPPSSIDTMLTVETSFNDFNKVNLPFKKTVKLAIPDNPFLSFNTDETLITADVQKLLEKKLRAIPVEVINLPPSMNALVIPAHLSLSIQGGINLIGPLTANDIKAYIDYRQKGRQSNEFVAYIEPIPQVKFKSIVPQKFKIVLERKENY